MTRHTNEPAARHAVLGAGLGLLILTIGCIVYYALHTAASHPAVPAQSAPSGVIQLEPLPYADGAEVQTGGGL